MKKVLPSLILAFIISVGLVPASANGIARTSSFTVEMAGFPDTVDHGGKVAGTFTFTLAPEVPIRRPQISYQIFISTPLGEAPVRTGSITIRNGDSKTVRIALPVADDIPSGAYTLRAVFSFGGEVATVSHALTVQ